MVREHVARRIPQKYRSVIGIDDVMQQTFVDVCREIGSFEPQDADSFPAWFKTIAERNLLDATRMLDAKKRGGDHKRITRPREASCRELIDLISASQSSPSSAAAGREAIGMLEDAVKRLPTSYRTVVEMYDLRNRPIEEISRELMRSEGAIYMLRARAHRMLAEILGSSANFFPHSRE